MCPAPGKLGGQETGYWDGRTNPLSRAGGLPSSNCVSVLPPSFSPHFFPHCVSFWLCVCLCHLARCPLPAEKAKSHLEVPLEENVNRRVLEEGSVEARTIEDAIAVLR